jgi:hypothetical protein
MLIVRVATICYDYTDETRARRLWEISAGTEPRGGAWHGCAAPPGPSPPPSPVREGCMSQSTPGALHIPPFYGWWMVWLGGVLSSLNKTAQTPPDLVVKLQPVDNPTVCLDVISLVASSCGYDRDHIEQGVAHEFVVHLVI